MYAARYYRNDGAGQLVCELCPRSCRLKPGQRAFCFVRENRDGEMVLSTYGRSSGFCVDPIEKKPLNHFRPGTPILSFGTAGCNLGCKFCQNWDISKAREYDRLADQASPEAIAEAARHAGCRAVAFTYNDPVIWTEYAIDVAAACHERGIETVAVTAGYVHGQARRDFFAATDAANVDLKAFTEDFYHKLSAAHLSPVLETLKYLREETDVWFELTTLVIPGQNDDDDEFARLAAWVARELGPSTPLHFTAFHPDYKMMSVPPTPPATLTRARHIARREGLHHVYTGNVHDPDGQTTTCHGCGAVLIERDRYDLGQVRIGSDGACPDCGEVLPGRFDDTPGRWGMRRLRVVP